MANIPFFNQSILINENDNNNIDLEELPQSSDLKVNDYITGSGVDQDVRIYVSNESENLSDNQEFFEIPSLTTDDMFLTYGDFNFTFQNNFTTDYVLEDNSALYATDFISFDYDTGSSGIFIANGTKLSGGFADLIDNTNSTFIYMNATQGLLNFTINADFTGTTYTQSGIMNGNVEFNRTKILGLIYSLVYRVFTDANLTVRVKDYSQSTWNDVISKLPINSSLGIQEIDERFINENLNFIDLSDICFLQFIFERDDNSPFITRLYEYDMQSTYAFDLPITNQEYVGLEFDLKGQESAVNGFYAWIRTLNLTEAATSQLNITLYRSNTTIVRTISNLRSVQMGPDYGDMIDSQLVSYSGDSLTYFEFNTVNTGKLNLSNYFIVIKSTNSKEVYSLVSLPFFNFGDDGKTEHKLITTSNDGIRWENAEKIIDTDNPPFPYYSGQLDASSFKLNVTRGYMPSDFTYNDNQTLRVQDIPIENLEINSYPYNESSYLTWGLGRWNYSFTPVIEDTPTNQFQVYMSWNASIIQGFKFNVSYSINAYWVEPATTNYKVKYGDDPEWIFGYNFDNNDPKFNNWDFFEFWFVYPDYMNAHNLTNPNSDEFLWQLEDESVITDSPSKLKLVINESFSILNGIYTLNLTSFNFIHSIHSYIKYYGELWETSGFMYGDNISLGVDIQDHNSVAPLSGDVNATLFYPNGTRYPGAEFYSSSGIIDDSVLSYDFNNATILDITKDLNEFGEYQLGFFWFNGSALGCKKLTLYIDTYDLELYNCTYLPNLQSNVLIGEIFNKVFQNYTILIASINDTTGISMPNFYPVNESELNQEYIYNLGGQDLTLLMESFLQSEDILNPNEIVNFKTTIQNTHPFVPLDVSINVKLTSFINEEWIIAEQTSSTESLNFSGHPNDTYTFDVNLTIPNLDVVTNTWEGVNAPIRLGGAKTIVTIYIDDIEVGIYESADYSLLSNETSNNYEGYILGIATSEELTSKSLLYEFERDECIYFPDNSSFLVNIIDKNYVSSYNQFNDEYSLRLNSIFTDIRTTPNNPRKGEFFNLSSILTTEFGEELSGKNVSCEYYSSSSWVFLDSLFTNVNGSVKFLIETVGLDFEGDLLLRLSWSGDIVNGVSKNITVNIIQVVNNFSISITQQDTIIYKSRITSLRVVITNIGNSTLRFFNISVTIGNDLEYLLVEVNYIDLDWLPAGGTTFLVFEIEITEVNTLEFIFSISAQNIVTEENLTLSKESSFQVFDPPIAESIMEYFIFIIIGAFVLIWAFALLYSRRIKKRIEEPVEVPIPRPRKGRYVPVAELKKPEPVKQIKKKKPKKAPEEAQPEKTTDLDSLLEERGLAEKDKKKEPSK
jgi:hypothetical protein